MHSFLGLHSIPICCLYVYHQHPHLRAPRPTFPSSFTIHALIFSCSHSMDVHHTTPRHTHHPPFIRFAAVFIHTYVYVLNARTDWLWVHRLGFSLLFVFSALFLSSDCRWAGVFGTPIREGRIARGRWRTEDG
ncbi:hypothetical protein R3P38DRAFT_2860637, partial [Favolaschia claudopus]